LKKLSAVKSKALKKRWEDRTNKTDSFFSSPSHPHTHTHTSLAPTSYTHTHTLTYLLMCHHVVFYCILLPQTHFPFFSISTTDLWSSHTECVFSM
jgi:hypothetical protein